ncbi:hypothetical protein F5Y16DRAFT_408458 [Xylariaceae sp. FL0255]|nr:hypothetical protein F5Y16DRAFT_408458 [Xylariaceae sp. FL0255]
MLYEPAPMRNPDVFEMIMPEASSKTSRFRKYSPSTTSSTSSVFDTSSIPFPHLFASFGRRLPEGNTEAKNSTIVLDSYQTAGNIIASNIFFSNMSRVGKLSIDWVPDITQHLELDERSRSLKLFASPSFCALICLSDPKSTFPLNRLITASNDDLYQSIPDIETQPFDDYCREILLSFGIIFGQDKRSRKAALRASKHIWQKTFKRDQLLRQLCLQPWCDTILYDYLHSPPVRANYSLRHDFLFLGVKLAAVQEYMNLQSPNDFITVLFDVRDPLRFWTFVAAIGLGSASILIGIMQTALAVAQVALSKP